MQQQHHHTASLQTSGMETSEGSPEEDTITDPKPVLKATAPGIHNEAKDSGNEAAEAMERLYQCHVDLRRVTASLYGITQDPRCRLCPENWLWKSGHCYFFSVGLEEDQTWGHSAEFCRQNNASLAFIGDHDEMELIQEVMRGFPRLPFLWVGLTDAREEGQWVWWDGNKLQLPINPETEVEWDSENRDCADLRGDGCFFAVDCQAYGPWVCEREA
ncbi:CD209 antigen-like protein C isoform X2 [Esox lucius]|uniref:CD209 antigen-like protein C isoform X2 n=1 Tax=Esox lucius TaxID=8010 RepID=UPI00147724D4|nr:CD209 antigen-like protein C isoform X2 [Esox lucius]